MSKSSEQQKGLLILATIALSMVAVLVMSVCVVGVAEAAPVDDVKSYTQCHAVAMLANNADVAADYKKLLKPYMKNFKSDIRYFTAYTDGYVSGIADITPYTKVAVAKQLLARSCNISI